MWKKPFMKLLSLVDLARKGQKEESPYPRPVYFTQKELANLPFSPSLDENVERVKKNPGGSP